MLPQRKQSTSHILLLAAALLAVLGLLRQSIRVTRLSGRNLDMQNHDKIFNLILPLGGTMTTTEYRHTDVMKHLVWSRLDRVR